ncbi:deoxycytidylate deaminase [Trichogramma pretiosum]|uniref:deoxycytidylate deaminase n=1 Tax=Trichogramma pretiosum TaxID=7493 RepID=UPI0006C9DECA|nr:deoxycytidylate deaminase [Trichogramma pretiosum]
MEELSLDQLKISKSNGCLSPKSRDTSTKRSDYLNWEDYFMAVAFLAAMRSKDPVTQVGACIVNEDKKIVGVGYNGMPVGCSDEEFSWSKNTNNGSDSKHLYVCHAELNAIVNKNSESIKNCTIYVGLFPCNECAKVIIQSGIKKVMYLSDKHAYKVSTIAAKKMFDAAGVNYCQYFPKHKKIVIDFEEINWNEMSQLPSTPLKSNVSNGHVSNGRT